MTLGLDGTLTVPGSLLTTADGVNDIGSIMNSWNNLYLKDSIRLGTRQIQVFGDEIQFSPNISAYNLLGAANLTTLEVGATANLGEVGNVTITGGSSGQVLTTNGSGALSWAFPKLPNFATDADANTAVGTPSLGMMYFDTTTEEVKVYKTAGWIAI
jgi:hypothetical protein